jgi:hypothetical protein
MVLLPLPVYLKQLPCMVLHMTGSLTAKEASQTSQASF